MAKHTIGWIGLGRMGYPMAELLLKEGNAVKLWNRTKSKAEPLSKYGGIVVDRPADMGDCDVIFTMVATGKDLDQVIFGPDGVIGGQSKSVPKIFVDCTSIGLEDSAATREKLEAKGAAFLAVPVSGNGKCVKAGILSAVASGPRTAYDEVSGYIETFARNGVSYVGEGELARMCKIAHNVMLGVVIQNLCEITILAQKLGVPRHAFLEWMNNSVMGSAFTRYKSPALVNLDWTTTFTPELLRKDVDLGLATARRLDVAMPVTAATREAIQSHFGAAARKPDPKAYIESDFSALLETVALAAGITDLESENKDVPTGLELAAE